MSIAEPAQVAEAVVAAISEPLTWAEICARYPDEWVCLAEMDRANPYDFEFRKARVIGHGKTRGEPVAQVHLWGAQYELIGHYYTGRITERPPRPQIVFDAEGRPEIRYRPSLVLDDELRALLRHGR
jgi:hypothetical protein